MYDWEDDKNNMVVSHLDFVLKRLKKDVTPLNKWSSKVLLRTHEEVIHEFVNINGKPTNSIEYLTDDDGRQPICFFLTTLRAHEEVPRAAKLVSNRKNKVRMAMEVEQEDDDCSFETLHTATVDDIKAELGAEMDGKLNNLATQIHSHTELIEQKMQANMENLMKNMIEQVTYQFQAASVAQQAPVPDKTTSY
jgi:hypothetical protein